MGYTKHFNTKQTSQLEPIPGKDMKENNAGGFSFEIDTWARLDRFLILGSEGGTYYVGEKKLTVDNAKNVVAAVKADGKKAVDRIVEISVAGRAPKNDQAIFALALACTFGDADTKKYAYSKITDVCRIGTFLFYFCQCIQDLRGWSRGLRNGVGKFYKREAEQLAYQLVKYQQRNGWTHRDVLRLSHATRMDDMSLKYAVKNKDMSMSKAKINVEALPKIIIGYELIKGLNISDYKGAIKLISEYSLPRECVPTEFFNYKEVWEALLDGMPMTAMIRNLGKMTQIGLLGSAFDTSVKYVCEKLQDKELLRKARVHPLSVITALKIYAQGKGMKGNLEWNPVAKIQEALNDAFYLAFDAVEPTGKNHLLALDVSGSMGWGTIIGSPLTYRDASAVMAMVTYRTEPNTEIISFHDTTVPINLTKSDSLDTVIRKINDLPFGRTDCAEPMLYALKHKLPIDVFCIYTDSETWCGNIHPVQALQKYRKETGINAKSVVIGMAANEFSIADPNDLGMLDVVGFDTATPALLSEFVKG